MSEKPRCECGSVECGLLQHAGRWWCAECIWKEIAALQAIVKDVHWALFKLDDKPHQAWSRLMRIAQGTGDQDGVEACRLMLELDMTPESICEMKAIVDKYPKTKDGVTVVPDMEVWVYTIARGYVKTTVLGLFRLQGVWHLDVGFGPHHPAIDCYSTREATGAAKES